MKLSEVLRMDLIEMYEEKYKHNKYILNMEGRHIHYEKEELEEIEEQNKFIEKLLDFLKNDN